jgi:hypothetical protein
MSHGVSPAKILPSPASTAVPDRPHEQVITRLDLQLDPEAVAAQVLPRGVSELHQSQRDSVGRAVELATAWAGDRRKLIIHTRILEHPFQPVTCDA